jgi:hypothetical protein
MVTDRQPAHPLAEQCTAKSKRSGQRCQHFVIGGGPCHLHGGKSPRAAAAREARIIAAQAHASGAVTEYRDPGEALVSAAVDADRIVQLLKRSLESGETLKAGELRSLGEWLDRTGRLAKTVLDARVDERKVRITELQHRELFAIIGAVLAELGHDPDSPEMIEVVRSCAARIGAGARPRAVVRGEVLSTPDPRGEVSRAVSRAPKAPVIVPVSCSEQTTPTGDNKSPSTPQTGA